MADGSQLLSERWESAACVPIPGHDTAKRLRIFNAVMGLLHVVSGAAMVASCSLSHERREGAESGDRSPSPGGLSGGEHRSPSRVLTLS